MALTVLIIIVVAQLCGVYMSFGQIFTHLNMSGLCAINPPLSAFIISWYGFHGVSYGSH
jgi:hypothetical protein